MLLINNISNNAYQQFVLTGIPSLQIDMTLRFLPRVQTWMMDISYTTQQFSFTADGIAVQCSPNVLRKWRNIIPFGISCITQSGLDPYQLTDFSSGASNLYLLNATDVTTIEDGLF